MKDGSPDHRRLVCEIHELILARLDERITKEQVERLEYLVIHQEAARKIYVQAMLDTVALRWWAQEITKDHPDTSRELDSLRESLLALKLAEENGEKEDGVVSGSVSPVRNGSSSSGDKRGREVGGVMRHQTWWGYAAAIGVCGLVGMMVMLMTMGGESRHIEEPVARLSASHEAVWEDASGRKVSLEAGKKIMAGELRLMEGLAKIEFSTGAVAVLDARKQPIQVDLKTGKAVHLFWGQLAVLAEGRDADGFTISLSNGRRVVDRGTEFGVFVDQKQSTQVQVFDGVVETYQLSDSGEMRNQKRLLENERVQISEKGDEEEFDSDASSEFILADDFELAIRPRKVGSTRVSETGGNVIVETYTFPDEEGRPLSWYRKSYPDNGYELIDGRIGKERYSDPAWVGWADGRKRGEPDSGTPQPIIEFDFGSMKKVGRVEIVYLLSPKGAVYAPDRVDISFSNDKGFKSVVYRETSADFASDTARRGVRRTRIDLKKAVEARYVRMEFYNDRNWTFLGEVEFKAPEEGKP